LPFKLNINKKSMLKFTKVASVLLQRYIALWMEVVKKVLLRFFILITS
jgi:hypothetical protein